MSGVTFHYSIKKLVGWLPCAFAEVALKRKLTREKSLIAREMRECVRKSVCVCVCVRERERNPKTIVN